MMNIILNFHYNYVKFVETLICTDILILIEDESLPKGLPGKIIIINIPLLVTNNFR